MDCRPAIAISIHLYKTPICCLSRGGTTLSGPRLTLAAATRLSFPSALGGILAFSGPPFVQVPPAIARGMMPDVERGTRSAHDAQPWTCGACGAVNEPIQCLVFDIPKFKCHQCQTKFDGDFDFCLGDIRVNGQLLVRGVLRQEGDTCLANAICHTVNMVHAMDSILMDQEVDNKKLILNADELMDRYTARFPSLDAVPGHLRGIHKLVNMSLIVKNEGIKLQNGEFYKIGGVCAIPGDDFEAICEELAQGNPLITMFNPGAGFFMGLEYCQVYKAPLLTEVTVEVNEHGEDVDAHAVILIGAFSRHGIRGFYFLNSHGVTFCARNITEEPQEERPRPVSGGIGKIEEKFSYSNAVKFLRMDEAVGDEVERLGDEADPDTVSSANRTLIFGDLPTRLLSSEEDEVLFREEQLRHRQELAELLREQEAQEQRLKEEEDERQAQQLEQLGL